MKIEELLDQFNIPRAPEGHHHTRPGWVNVDCPFCGEDSKSYHLGYCLGGQYFTCWKCGYHPLIKTLMELTRNPYKTVKKWVGVLEHDKMALFDLPDLRGKLVLPSGLGPLRRAHREYLEGRGFQPERLAEMWQLQGIGQAVSLSWRIFIPVIHKGRTVSWTTRAIVDGGLRYRAAEAHQEILSTRSLLYGYDLVRSVISVHEGPTNVWRVGPGSTATLGLGYSQEQVAIISKHPKRIICFDNEPKAQERALQLCDNLSIFPGETINVCLDANDAASASDKEIKRFRRLLE